MKLLRTLAAHTAIYGLSSILGRVINWLLTPLYVHRFPLEDFGVLSDLYALIIFVQIGLTFGMETSFFFYARKEEEDKQNAYGHAFALVCFLSLSFGLLTLVFHKPLAEALGYSERISLLLLLVPVFVFDALAALPLARLRYRSKPVRFASISLVNIGLTLALNLYWVAWLGLGIEYVLVANLIASGVRLMMALYDNLPDLKNLSKAFLLKMTQYGSLIVMAGLMGAINEGIDRNLLPRLWPKGGQFNGRVYSGLALNGIYAAVYKLAVLIALVTQAFRYAVEPLLFRQSGEQNAARNMAMIFHYFGLICLLTFLLVGSFGYEIVSFNAWGLSTRTLIPQKYWIGLSVLPLLLAANVFFGLYQQASMWYKLQGKLRFGLYYSAVGAGITLVLNVVLIPRIGFYACGLATFTCYLTMLILCLRGSRQHDYIPWKLGRLSVYAVLTAITWGANWSLQQRGLHNFSHSMLKLLFCLICVAIVVHAERKYPCFKKSQG